MGRPTNPDGPAAVLPRTRELLSPFPWGCAKCRSAIQMGERILVAWTRSWGAAFHPLCWNGRQPAPEVGHDLALEPSLALLPAVYADE